MDDRLLLSDAAWWRLRGALAGLKSPRGAPPSLGDRDFIEAVLYLARTGVPWRDLPRQFGKWQAVYQRFRRWLDRGVWAGLLAALPGAGLEAVTVLFVDSTIVRAHPHAAGAARKKGAKMRRPWVAAAADSRPRSTRRRRTIARPSCSG
jgi:putative transposase